jgi:hypothetical protein
MGSKINSAKDKFSLLIAHKCFNLNLTGQANPFCARKIRTYWYWCAIFIQGVIDGRKATKNGAGSERVMLLGDARIKDERGRNIEETEHRLHDDKRIHNERPANRKGGMEALGWGD